MLAENDERGIAPGSNLLEALFKKYAPALILIDEWVAYLRQIYKVEGAAVRVVRRELVLRAVPD